MDEMKFKVTWWFLDSVEGICRGTDFVETDNPEFDDLDALDIMGEIMEAWGTEDHKMPTFAKNVISPAPNSWGVLNIVKRNFANGGVSRQGD